MISRASILILSGFLVGMVTSRSVVPGTELSVLAAALTGVLSYVVLDHVSCRREQRVVREACRRTTKTLENRIDRHISRDFQLQAGRLKRMRLQERKVAHSENPYLSVVTRAEALRQTARKS